MIIWKIIANEGYNNAFLIDENGKQIFEKGTDFMEYIDSPHIRKIRIDIGSNGFPDVMNYWGTNGTCIVNDKVMNIISNKFHDSKVQFFPCYDPQFPDMKFWLLNAYNFQDVLDVSKSKYRTLINFQGAEVISNIKKYAFKDTAFQHDIFKLLVSGQKRTTALFISDKFKQTMEDSEVTGLAYKKMYEVN